MLAANIHLPFGRTRLRARSLGYGLLEIALGIAVAALLGAWAMMYFQNANFERKVNETLQLVMLMRQIAENNMNGQPDNLGLTTASILRSRQLPAKFVKNGTHIRSPWGTDTVIARNTTDGGVGRMKIAITSIPHAACVALATRSLGQEVFIVNNTVSARPGNPGTRTASAAMTPAAATAACSSTLRNDLGWVF